MIIKILCKEDWQEPPYFSRSNSDSSNIPSGERKPSESSKIENKESSNKIDYKQALDDSLVSYLTNGKEKRVDNIGDLLKQKDIPDRRRIIAQTVNDFFNLKLEDVIDMVWKSHQTDGEKLRAIFINNKGKTLIEELGNVSYSDWEWRVRSIVGEYLIDVISPPQQNSNITWQEARNAVGNILTPVFMAKKES